MKLKQKQIAKSDHNIQQLNSNFSSKIINSTGIPKINTNFNDYNSLKEQDLLNCSYNLCKSQSGCISLQQAINTFSDFADKLFLKVIYFINNSFLVKR